MKLALKLVFFLPLFFLELQSCSDNENRFDDHTSELERLNQENENLKNDIEDLENDIEDLENDEDLSIDYNDYTYSDESNSTDLDRAVNYYRDIELEEANKELDHKLSKPNLTIEERKKAYAAYLSANAHAHRPNNSSSTISSYDPNK